mgnify:CR=1 FL=1
MNKQIELSILNDDLTKSYKELGNKYNLSPDQIRYVLRKNKIEKPKVVAVESKKKDSIVKSVDKKKHTVETTESSNEPIRIVKRKREPIIEKEEVVQENEKRKEIIKISSIKQVSEGGNWLILR